ncbi:MAG: UDP-glucose 4-epimerase GalE [Bacilli bacterium]
MSILVTGGAGYIGSHTVVELLNRGQEVVIVDNFYNAKPEVLKRIEIITGKQPHFYELDVLDEKKLNAIFKQHLITAVIHFAGYKAVGESVSQPLMYYHNNLNSTLTLIKVMLAHQVYQLVFSSSATVYGNPSKMPLVETDPVGGTTNPYGSTKLINEMIIEDVVKANPKFQAIILRYFNPIGAHPSGFIGEDPQGIPNNLMPFITQVAIGKRSFLNIYGNDYPTVDGTGVRDYIHVVDLALGHLAALAKLKDNPGFAVYNLGTGKGTSVLEMVKAFEQATGMTISYKIVARRPGDIAVSYANANKALKELGWKTEKTVLDACKDSWHWQQKNPKGFTN